MVGSRWPINRSKFVRQLPFLAFVLLAAFFSATRSANASCAGALHGKAACLAQAPSRAPTTQPTESQGQGNDTLKLASLGVVFLLIGAAVVYAPQIVAAISGFPRRLTGQPRPKAAPTKASKPPAPRPEETRPVAPIEPPTRPLPAPTVVGGPLDTGLRPNEPDDVVTRLQSEIRSAWSRTR